MDSKTCKCGHHEAAHIDGRGLCAAVSETPAVCHCVRFDPVEFRLDTITLSHGGHASPDAGMCAMEAVAYIAGEPHSDHPACVSPVIAAALRRWNDNLPDNATRDRLIKPLLPHVIGTAGSAAVENRRAWMATDWLVRVHTPVWLRLAGFEDHARTLEGLERYVDAATARSNQSSVDAARAAVWAAVWDGEGAAAGVAAVWDAEGVAARVAVWESLIPARKALQASFAQLILDMAQERDA